MKIDSISVLFQNLTTIDGFALVLILINTLILIFNIAGRKYLEEKAKNLATKQDIAEITTTVELIKRELSERSHISLFRYEKEYEILVEISKKLFSFLESFNELLKYFENIHGSEELNSYQSRMRELREYCSTMRPFYSSDIFNKVIELDRLCFGGISTHAVLVKSISKQKPDLAHRATGDLGQINAEIYQSIDQLNEIIRNRVADWENLKGQG